MTVLAVVLGGAIGAPLRYVIDVLVQSRHRSDFPWGTFTVNVVGSLVLGITAAAVVELDSPPWVLAFVGTGICGALTTFSTFSYETVRLLDEGSAQAAVANCLVSVVVGLGACAGGFVLASTLL